MHVAVSARCIVGHTAVGWAESGGNKRRLADVFTQIADEAMRLQLALRCTKLYNLPSSLVSFPQVGYAGFGKLACSLKSRNR